MAFFLTPRVSPSLPQQRSTTVPPRRRVASKETAQLTEQKESVHPKSSLKERTRRVQESQSLLGVRPLTRQAMASMPVVFREEGDAAGQKPLRILCYGDSLTAGFYQSGSLFEPYGRSLSRSLGDAGVANEVSVCGMSGRTAREMVGAIDGALTDVVGFNAKGLGRLLDEKRYDLVIIMTGTNDMGMNEDIKSIVHHTTCLHAACHKRGVATMLLSPPPAPCTDAQRERVRKHLLRLLRDYAETCPNIKGCLDSADFFPSSGGKLWDGDGLHFSCIGSRSFGKRLAMHASESLVDDPKQSLAVQLPDAPECPVVQNAALKKPPAMAQLNNASKATPTRRMSTPNVPLDGVWRFQSGGAPYNLMMPLSARMHAPVAIIVA